MRWIWSDRTPWGYLFFAVLLLGCTSSGSGAIARSVIDADVRAPTTTPTSAISTTSSTAPTTAVPSTTAAPPRPPPTVLTAEDLVDRRIDTFDALTPPPSDEFVSEIWYPAPDGVITRSTWSEECPIEATELAYAQVSFYGFDGEFHTGELLLHETYAEQLVAIFERLHEMRFPIEQMAVVSQADLELGPTGEENNTTVFTCRRSVSSSNWSRHAFGDAVDINPFHNPYVSSRVVIPELATAYADRDRDVPGLVDEEVRQMFEEIGWGWGGNWNSVKDWMHFSATGG